MQGVRTNQLVGYGLVVGLDGTGDQTTSTPFTIQSLLALLQQMGVTVPAGTNMQLKNVAAVMVTAQLPPFAQPGQTHRRQRLVAGQRQEPARRHADRDAAEGRRRPDLRDGAGQHGDRRRRRLGGRLQGADQHAGAGPHPRRRDGRARRRRRRSTRATRSSSTSTRATSTPHARSCARSTPRWAAARRRRPRRPRRPGAHAGLGRRAGRLHGRHREPDVKQAAPSAKVVINARTGSIVMNQTVTLAACAVAHGNLSVTISTTPTVSQPGRSPRPARPSSPRRPTSRSPSRPASLIQLPAGHQARRRRQGAQFARRDAAGPARDPAGA